MTPDRLRRTCVYATGSIGRGEASGFSDLDIFLLDLGAQRPPVAADDALAMFALSPSERLEHLAAVEADAVPLISTALEHYAWFLDKTDHPKDDLVRWISERDDRHAARQRNRAFGTTMYDLISLLNRDGPLLRYLVV